MAVKDLKDIGKVQISGITEAMATGVMKSVSERMLSKTFVGNGTLKSGAIKLGAGVLIPNKKNIIVSSLKNALVIDGIEDIVNVLMNNFNIGGFSFMGNSTNSLEVATI